jgi:hypothetical protein
MRGRLVTFAFVSLAFSVCGVPAATSIEVPPFDPRAVVGDVVCDEVDPPSLTITLDNSRSGGAATFVMSFYDPDPHGGFERDVDGGAVMELPIGLSGFNSPVEIVVEVRTANSELLELTRASRSTCPVRAMPSATIAMVDCDEQTVAVTLDNTEPESATRFLVMAGTQIGLGGQALSFLRFVDVSSGATTVVHVPVRKNVPDFQVLAAEADLYNDTEGAEGVLAVEDGPVNCSGSSVRDGSAALPATGPDSPMLPVAGVAVLLSGGTLILVARRGARRSAAAS